MIDDEFYTIAGRVLKENRLAKTIQVTRISPTGLGPLVEWTASKALDRKPKDPERVHGAPASAVLNVLARTLAFRWRTGRPLCPLDWETRLSREFQDVVPWPPSVGPGWFWLLEGAADFLTRCTGSTRIVTHEIKEKYGTLLWEISTSDFSPEADEYLDCVDLLSGFICEDCGAPGEVTEIRGWMRCRCLSCTGAAI